MITVLDDAVSCGFCLFNNVAVGALHALRNREDCPRVAIIDFDVHHGNGTQGVVDALGTSTQDRLFFFSIHLYDSCENCVEQPDIYPTLEVRLAARCLPLGLLLLAACCLLLVCSLPLAAFQLSS